MPSAFEQLKKKRANSIDKLAEQLDKMSNNRSSAREDLRYWKPTKDASGNAFAIIRFLDAPEGEEDAFVKTYDHGFQGPTGLYYIENSLSTLGKDDPAVQYGWKLYNASKDKDSEERKMSAKVRARTHFISNIYVVQDNAKPENVGKVFLFKFGKKIFDKLNSLANPEFEDEQAVNPFNLWDGANFRLKMRVGDGGYPNYDKSEFDSPSPLSEDDDEIERIWKQCYSLQAEIAPDKFKSYDELKERLDKVLGLEETKQEDKDDSLDMSKYVEETPRKNKEVKASSHKGEPPEDDDDDEDELAVFAKLARESSDD